jgi:hypothetical protein
MIFGWFPVTMDNVRYTPLKCDSTLRPSAVCSILRLAAGRLDLGSRVMRRATPPAAAAGFGRPDELADVGVRGIGHHPASEQQLEHERHLARE